MNVAGALKSNAARLALLALAILLVVFFRSPDVILSPSLEAEDGAFVFPRYYMFRDVSELLRFQAGYIPLVLNLIAFFSVRLPTTLIPYGFAYLPLLLALVAYTWLFDRRFAETLGPDANRALMCLLFVLVPFSQYHIYANATYSIWNALFLLLLLSVTPLSGVAWRDAAVWLAMNVLAWSNPATILVGPIIAVRLVRERSVRLFHAATLVNLVAYVTFGVEKGGIFHGLTWAESIEKLAEAAGWTVVAVSQMTFRTVFGSRLLDWADAHAWPLIAVWALLLLAAVLFEARRTPRFRPVLAVLAYVIFAFTFVGLLTRGPMNVFPLNAATRYMYVQSLAFLVLAVLLLEAFVVRGHARRRVAVFAAAVVVSLALNFQMGHFFVATSARARPADGPCGPYVQSHEGNGRIVREYFAELARREQQNGSREGIFLRADKPGDWPIVIDTRNPARERK